MLDLAILRQALGWSVDREADIERTAQALIDLLERQTARLWNRRVGYVHTTRVRTCTREVGLVLWPVESIAKIEVRCLSDVDWTEIELDSDCKLTSDARGNDRVLYRIGSTWEDEVRVTMTGGYTEDTTIEGAAQTPDEVVNLLILQARFDDQRGSSDRVAVSSLATNGAQTNFMNAKFHPQFEQFCLDNRRRF